MLKYMLIALTLMGCSQTDTFKPTADGPQGAPGAAGEQGEQGVAGQSGLPDNCVTAIREGFLYFTCPQGVAKLRLRVTGSENYQDDQDEQD